MEYQNLTSHSATSVNPVFLVGAERSGTTLLRLMLDHHPEIAWCNEFEYSVDCISEEGQWPPLNSYYEWLETHRIFQATGFLIDRSLGYPDLMTSFLLQKLNRDQKSIIGATVHRHFDRLLKLWPNARFIHILRDGRDVAKSCIAMGWAGNFWTGAERWIDAEQLWEKVKEILPTDRYLEVTYEQLITNPENTLADVCKFIGVNYDQAMMKYAETTTYDKPDASLIYQWKRKMSARDIQLVESRLGDMLTQRGYALSGLQALTVTPWMQRQLLIQDRWERAQARVRVYGLGLCVSNFISRRLKLKAWEKQTQLKINAITTSRLK